MFARELVVGDEVEAVGLVGVADERQHAVGDEEGAVGPADGGEVGEVVGAPQLRGTRWWIWRPLRWSQPGQRQCPSRNGTARVILGGKAGRWRPIAIGAPVSSTSLGSISALARNCSSAA